MVGGWTPLTRPHSVQQASVGSLWAGQACSGSRSPPAAGTVTPGLVAQAQLGPSRLQRAPPPELVCISLAQSISTTKWCPPDRGCGNATSVNWIQKTKKPRKLPILQSAQSEREVGLNSLSWNTSEVNALERKLRQDCVAALRQLPFTSNSALVYRSLILHRED